MTNLPSNPAPDKTPLYQCYWISGDDPLLVQETRTQIISHAKTQGYTEKHTLHYNVDFSEAVFSALMHNQSLFSEKKIIDVRNPTGKFNAQTTQTICAPHEEIVLIISTAKLTAAQQKSTILAWVKQHG